MTLLKSIILGLVQGLAEFLPISSSGHLVLVQTLFNFEDGGDLFFDVLLHLGTLASIFVVYRSDIADMIREFFSFFTGVFRRGGSGDSGSAPAPARRMVMLIIIATLPLVMVLPFKDFLEGTRSFPWLVGAALVITGLLLFTSDRFSRGRKTERSATWLDAVIVGLMQAVAVIPGISRSGSTISMGVFRGFNRKFAVRFSFLMSIPAVLGAALVEFIDAAKSGIDWSLMPVYLVGMAVAAVSGYFAIRLIKYIADRGRFGWFAFYCWAAGAVTIIVSLVGGSGAAA